MLAIRQIIALIWKNVLIVLLRHPSTTSFRAFVIPIIFASFLSYSKNLFLPPSEFGIPEPLPVRSLQDALDHSGGGRNTVAFVDNGFKDGNIQRVIDDVAGSVREAGKIVQILGAESELLTTCRSSLRAVSPCYGAAVFYASPDEGPGGMWNYTLRVDGGLGNKIDYKSKSNDAQIYTIPLQHAVDFAIARQNTTIDQAALPSEVFEYGYASQTEQERKDRLRRRYMGGIIDILAVGYFICMVVVMYQLVGLMASERELGMTQIIEASMPNKRRWEPQAIRFISYHLSFDIMFAPGWIIVGIVFALGIFTKTNLAIVLLYHIFIGLAISSFSIFGAAFFHKAQLSGIVTTIGAMILAVIAQVAGKASDGAVAILSLLFPPMNYVYFTILLARWERKDQPTNLVKAAPENPWELPGIVFFVFAIVQIIVFPLLASLVERTLYGTASKGRRLMSGNNDSNAAVRLDAYTKHYTPNWWARNIATLFGKKKETVVAVDQLELDIRRGQIMVLLGANGSGKSTTLEAIAGLSKVTSGNVTVDGQGGLGICPQKNVLWDHLTVFEHVQIFNWLKSTGQIDAKVAIKQLVKDCDLERKMNAQSRHLSGGQKRKLQLSIMFTGGSKVCCVDEVSSGVDALARQKLWNILLSERGKRTFIFTTHFLDEADLLSDQIAILSKGSLKAKGSAVELKHHLGSGYRIHVFKTPGETLNVPISETFQPKQTIDRFTYTLPGSTETANLVRQLDSRNIKNYEIRSPSIEEIFFSIAEDLEQMYPGALPQQRSGETSSSDDVHEEKSITAGTKEGAFNPGNSKLELETGRQTSNIKQVLTLFTKRLTIFQRNYLPNIGALIVPIIAAGLVTLFIQDFELSGCAPQELARDSPVRNILTLQRYEVALGPPNKLQPDAFDRIGSTLPKNSFGGDRTQIGNIVSGGTFPQDLPNATVQTLNGGLTQFNDYIDQRFRNVTPGGFFLGDASGPTTFAYRSNMAEGSGDLKTSIITQNLMDTLLTNISISTQYSAFDIPWVDETPELLQLVTYFGLVLAISPALLSLYPTLERLRHVRQLHYSNGVKSVNLWSAYLTFDFIFVLVASAVSVIIFRAVSAEWYHIEYLFVVLFLFGITSTLLSYVVSLFSKSQLAAFATAAGYQDVMFVLYFYAYLSVLTYAAPDKVESTLLIVHFCFAIVAPSASLIRALLVALNLFGTTCQGKTTIASYPGGIRVYGGPILYLIAQSVVLFGVLLWYDSTSIWARIRREKIKPEDVEEEIAPDNDVALETKRVASSHDGLRVQHMTKKFGDNVAVKDVSFGVQRGEVFALLGPNGAGKSTIMSLIRGDILPSHTSGDIMVEDIAISKRRAAARTHLGVCPQVDACDQMTVIEHLRFYARVRGVINVDHNVHQTIQAVGLEPFKYRLAAKLSGGNKRKLSLAIALMGNPSVLLLDEPSSGMDVCAKRVMWKILTSIVPGRSLLLTTHSMEEADALADRAGIMGRKMLAIGTSEGLRRKFGDRYHVHLITTTAPYTSDEEMVRIKQWVMNNLPGAIVEEKTFHGQLRFSVPANHSSAGSHPEKQGTISETASDDEIVGHSASGVGALFTTLEAQKQQLGFEHYSVSQTTLDQVFLTIVTKHQIEEENYGEEKKGKVWKRILRKSMLLI